MLLKRNSSVLCEFLALHWMEMIYKQEIYSIQCSVIFELFMPFAIGYCSAFTALFLSINFPSVRLFK